MESDSEPDLALPAPRESRFKALVPLALACLACLAVLGLLARSTETRAEVKVEHALRGVVQEWAPTRPEEVLPMEQWAKVFKVDDLNSSTAQRRYYQYSHHPIFIQKKAWMEDQMSWQIARECPPLSIGIDLVLDKAMPAIRDVPSPSDCQKACTETPECLAFAWVRSGNLTRTCFRKTSATMLSMPTQVPKDSFVSGRPCLRENRTEMRFPTKELEQFKLPSPPPAPPRPRGAARMLCLAVCLPFTQEQDLLVMQYRFGTHIFACDNYAIYSSLLLELVPGVFTRRVNSTLLGELGGPYMTVLNLAAFMAVWKQVLADGEYLHHDWILKVDPDTVFLVDRLRPILQEHGRVLGQSGAYLNNCDMGLHGPLEIFSRQALNTFFESSEYCAKQLDGGKECKKDCSAFWDPNYRERCNGPCTLWWGEDIWVDQCLMRFTEVARVYDPRLLTEEHCHPQSGWRNCKDPSSVAFHPFKTPQEYKTCFESATGHELIA